MFTFFFFFNDTATTEIYTLSLHDALPISSSATLSPRTACSGRPGREPSAPFQALMRGFWIARLISTLASSLRSEEHTSELQSLAYLVCRLLLEKKKKKSINTR